MALPRSHRSAFQSVKNKENRDLVSQNPQNFLACGAASRSLRLTITRAGVLAVVHLVATPFRITTLWALLRRVDRVVSCVEAFMRLTLVRGVLGSG